MEGTRPQILVRGSEQQKSARQKLIQLFQSNPLPPEQLVTNLALFMRSSVVAKLLYINELYQEIIKIPGVVLEFGVWWGQNMVLFEALRAIYEPYNYTRRVIGFDTFSGYTAPSDKDGNSEYVAEGAYSLTEQYEEFLTELLEYHQQENSMAHIKRYELVKGNAATTINEYLEKNPETIIALAYFDLQLYEPTKKCLEAIRPHLTRGSVIAMDEINCHEFPGETIALKEVWDLNTLRIQRSQFLPDRSYVVFN
jgi:Macrocin-O-methyltransferase (TylF)